jgi:hypothetical protein
MDQKIILASQLLKLSTEEVEKYSKRIPEINGTYYWNPTRGGLHAIIDDNGERLGAASSISYEKLLVAFKNGKRN